MANIMVIIDGMTDVLSDELGGVTPFEYANTNSINIMKNNFAYGLQNTVPKGFDVDSMNCILTLLGVPQEKIPTGRAYIETAALGIPVGENDFVMRCNLVATDKNDILKSSCGAGLCAVQMAEISKRLSCLANKNLKFYHMSSYKNIIVIENAKALINEIKTFPPHQNMGKNIRDLTPQVKSIKDFFIDCENILNEYENHNFKYKLLVWGGCIKTEIPQFSQLHNMTSAAVAKTEIVRGIALTMGMNVPEMPTATADIDTDLTAKLNKTLSLAEDYEFVLLHLNGTDEASHRCQPKIKADFISHIDRDIISHLIDTKHKLLVCTDHMTSSKTGEHIGGYQPFYLIGNQRGDLGKHKGIDAVKLFGEQLQ